MAHPLVDGLRFARQEFSRALDGVPVEDGLRRLVPMNSLGWIVGHVTWQEQVSWLRRAQGRTLVPQLDELVAHGRPATTPPLDEMWACRRQVLAEVDPFLDVLTTECLLEHPMVDGSPWRENLGTMVQRVTYHVLFHMGEAMAIRQLLGHTGLPEFVGALPGYRPEA